MTRPALVLHCSLRAARQISKALDVHNFYALVGCRAPTLLRRVVAPVHQVQAVLRKALQLGHLQRGLSGPC